MDLVGHYLIAARARWPQPENHRLAPGISSNSSPDGGRSMVYLMTPSHGRLRCSRAYVIYQQDRRNVRTGLPLSGSHVNGLIRSLKAFCRWLHREELVSRDLFAKISVPKPPTLVVPTLSRPEIKQVLLAIRAGRQPKRDEALFLFMLDTGVRASELCGLDFKDLSYDWGIARVMGKGRKQRYVPISPKTIRAMQRYALAEKRMSGPIFRSSRGTNSRPGDSTSSSGAGANGVMSTSIHIWCGTPLPLSICGAEATWRSFSGSSATRPWR